MTEIDNGGAEAIKGFNFQKANLILIAVRNYKKPQFKIYIEAEDDIVVSYTGYEAYIQVKKQRHSLSTIIKSGKSKSGAVTPSILEKNLSSGTEDNTHKIIVTDISQKDKNKFVLVKPGSIHSEIFKLTDQAKTDLLKNLPSHLNHHLGNFYIYISHIHQELSESVRYLIGYLNEIGISVDDKRGRNIISELSLIIDQKGEVKVTECVDKEIKVLNQELFSSLFRSNDSISQFNQILDSLPYNSIKKSRIKKAHLFVDLSFRELKMKMKLYSMDKITEWDELNDKEIINQMVTNFKQDTINEETLIAIAIECLSEVDL
ncbi:dsDNA nuclease domain-containing protein [Paenibacillus xylanexedens]|uniref:dsDNA nuclease domain-containing protein n=1 Tax=Paenibacillus xylanexedens TaxID=528191 RepID=UPI0028EE3EFE|nr:dsDNA nuclease domain-containing protein [Paenibacillus xylanexedens]